MAIARPYIERFRIPRRRAGRGPLRRQPAEGRARQVDGAQPLVLLLDEPTRGLDVRAKRDVHDVVRELAAAGKGVIVSSSEAEEIAALCHRAIVLAQGNSRGELARDELTDANILRYAPHDAQHDRGPVPARPAAGRRASTGRLRRPPRAR